MPRSLKLTIHFSKENNINGRMLANIEAIMREHACQIHGFMLTNADDSDTDIPDINTDGMNTGSAPVYDLIEFRNKRRAKRGLPPEPVPEPSNEG